MIGHVEVLDTQGGGRPLEGRRASTSARSSPCRRTPTGSRCSSRSRQDHGLDEALDQELIRLAQPAIHDGQPVEIDLPIRNVNRTVGTMLGHEVTKAWQRRRACPTARSTSVSPARPARASARSCPAGITLRLEGDANDYLGKGLSGGRIIVQPAADVAVRRRGADHRRQRDRLRRDRRRDLPARHRRRALLRAQLGRHRRRRGRRRPRLRVHDRRSCRRARARPGATSAPACPAASPTCYDPDGDFRRQRQLRDGRRSSELDDDDRAFLRDVVARHRELTGSAVAERLLAVVERRRSAASAR